MSRQTDEEKEIILHPIEETARQRGLTHFTLCGCCFDAIHLQLQQPSSECLFCDSTGILLRTKPLNLSGDQTQIK